MATARTNDPNDLLDVIDRITRERDEWQAIATEAVELLDQSRDTDMDAYEALNLRFDRAGGKRTDER
jgi:hypothetical protein